VLKILGLPSDVGRPGENLAVGAKEPLGPCGQYRIKYPLDALSVQTDIEVEWGVYPLEYVWEKAREFDVIVLQRHVLPHFQSLVEHCRLFLKKRVVFDFDDVILDLDPRNPAYRFWGDNADLVWDAHQKALAESSGGPHDDFVRRLTKKDIWRLAQICRNGFIWMLQNVDLVTCTSKVIADRYAEYNDKIVVLPNCIEAADWADVKENHIDGKTVIGWAGGISHAPDLMAYSVSIAKVLRRFPQCIFMIVGFEKAKSFFPEDVQDQIKVVPWSGINEYRQWLGYFDIGIAPTQRILTNEAKSGIRIYEYALARPNGMAVVASPWPYKDDIHNGMGVVAPNTQKFEKALVRYVIDEDLRRDHGVALREHVMAEHTMDKNVWRWADAYGGDVR